MNETLFGSPLFASALFGVAMFFFFRWVFVERYSAEEAKNYAILIAFVCAVITWGAFGWVARKFLNNVSVRKVHVDRNTMLSKIAKAWAYPKTVLTNRPSALSWLIALVET